MRKADIIQQKIFTLPELLKQINRLRLMKKTIAFTNGCFDILHVGHISLIEKARQFGDRLIVAINSDDSVSALKGPGRPIVGERERSRVLAALAAVDAVVVFSEATPLETILTIRPDVIVKGGDYSVSSVVGAKEIQSWGGQVQIVPIVAGFSTTQLIDSALNGKTHNEIVP